MSNSEQPMPDWNLVGGIVLDAVGTLIEPCPSVAEAYLEAADRQGVRLAKDEVRSRFRAAFRDDGVHAGRGVYSTDESVERRRWRAIVAGVLPEVPDPALAFDELWDHFGRPESWRCFPDSAPAIRALHEAGVKVCVGSNFDGRLRGVVAGLPELADVVDALVVSSEVGYRKPHPEFFAAVCDHLGLPAGRVLSVGDDLENDVEGALRAGLQALHLRREGEPGGGPAGVASLAELMGLGVPEA